MIWPFRRRQPLARKPRPQPEPPVPPGIGLLDALDAMPCVLAVLPPIAPAYRAWLLPDDRQGWVAVIVPAHLAPAGEGWMVDPNRIEPRTFQTATSRIRAPVLRSEL